MKKSTFSIAIAFLLTAICLLPIFSFAQYTKLLEFSGGADGQYPRGDLFSDGNFLYGMTERGGINSLGIIFKVKPDGTGYGKLLDFAGAANGQRPWGSLISDGSFLYGMTQIGGINGMGVIFKIKPDGSNYTKLLDFSGIANGSYPEGSFIYDGSFLYGMTAGGGANSKGLVFKIKTDGTGYAKLLDFAGTSNGESPHASLISDSIYLYGMTHEGGAIGSGCIFKIRPDGTGYSKLHDFSTGVFGRTPHGSLVADCDFLYGMTTSGGIYGRGNIFKIKKDGTDYTNLFDFDNTNGAVPQGSLIYECPFLYGMTMSGGNANGGVAFKIKTDGTEFTNLINFTLTGNEPQSSFITDGTTLYGMTLYGGSFGDGTIFKYEYLPSNDPLCNPSVQPPLCNPSVQPPLYNPPVQPPSPPLCDDFFIPNLITPNGDGNNDRFKITSCGDHWKIEIYNRWGSKIFEKETYKDEWDGSDEAEGIYYYHILDKQTKKHYNGWVHLLR